jgi:hypothetical protein
MVLTKGNFQMMLGFTLSMPGCPSWNGKWYGEGRKYATIRSFVGKESIKTAVKILEHGRYHYSWDDGWCAGIDVHELNSNQARKLRLQSSGFCGYDWMVDSIIKYGKPMADHEVELHLAEACGNAMVPE